MTRLSRCLKTLLLLGVIIFATPAMESGVEGEVFCEVCKYSPSGWGFCRQEARSGSNSCQEVIVDPFNGTTNCLLSGQCYVENPPVMADDDPGEPIWQAVVDPRGESTCGWEWAGMPVEQLLTV